MAISVLSSHQAGVLRPSPSLTRARGTPAARTSDVSLYSSSARAPDAIQFDGLRCSATLGFASRVLSHEEAFLRRAAAQSQPTSRSDVAASPTQPSGRRAVVSAVFERFTERAIRAIMAAQKEASNMRRKEVATEQLLIGLIEIEGKASNQGTFISLGITPERVREAYQTLTAAGVLPTPPPAGEKPAMEIPFSLGCKHVFEAALEESRKLRHNFIAPEHLLVALLHVDMDGAIKILDRMGVRKDKLQAEAISRLRGQLADEGRSTANMPQPPTQPAGPTPAMAGAGLSSSTSVLSKSGRQSEKSILEEFCIDLTARAAEGAIDPVIGRSAEVERVIQILARRRKNSPMLLGEPGVGKTAIAEGLALRIADKTVPDFLLDKKVFSLDLGLLLAGTKERGELEKRVNTVISEAQSSGNVILVIDEIHTMVGMGAVARGGAAGSGLDVANLLKPALSRGQLQCIGATTLKEYRQHVEKDKALARRFQPVDVAEPSQDDAIEILMGLRSRYEAFHKCRISDEAITAAVELSTRYIADRFLPDKAIDLIDEAASRARIDNYRRRRQRESSVLEGSPEEYWKEIRAVQASQEAVLVKASSPLSSITNLISSGLESAAAAAAAAAVPVPGYAGRGPGETTAEAQKSEFEKRMQDYDGGLVVVGPEDIAAVASMWSGVPLQQLTSDEKTQLVGLEDALHRRVIGQDDAVSAIARAVRRARVGLKDPKRPIATLMFCGPTGVGKTELAKALSQEYFGTEAAMIRLDMSEYMERHSVSKLVGAPPGYIGYDEPGKLTEAVRRRPFSLILFDEIEKAHPDFFNMLLQIFEDGRLTDSKGRVVDFKNTLLVMTSNVGSQVIARGGSSRVGFTFGLDDESGDGGRYAALKETVGEELKGHFRPELLNRIDEVVVFRPLEKSQVRSIVEKMMQESVDRLAQRGIRLEVSEAVIVKVCEEGYDRSYGARPLRRAVARIVEDPVSESVLAESGYGAGDTALVDLDEQGNVVVSRLPLPDVCEHGLCLEMIKVPASAPVNVGHPD